MLWTYNITGHRAKEKQWLTTLILTTSTLLMNTSTIVRFAIDGMSRIIYTTT